MESGSRFSILAAKASSNAVRTYDPADTLRLAHGKGQSADNLAATLGDKHLYLGLGCHAKEIEK